MLKMQRTDLVRSFALLALTLSAASLTACKANSNYFAENSASVGSGNGNAVDGAAGFKFSLKSKSGVDAFVHKFGDAKAKCEIPLADATNYTSLRCMLNMMEYDMWFYGYEYEVSVPKGFCTYLRETPYRYYKAEAGFGPSTLLMAVTNGAITGCTIDGVAGTIGPSAASCSNSEVSFKADGSVGSCRYDYSKRTTNPGPNCCDGRVLGAISVTTAGTTVTNPIDFAYGGSYVSCTESPMDYISDWPKYVSNQKAAPVVTDTAGGSLSRSVKLPSPFSLRTTRVNYPANFLNAGFYGWDDYAANSATWDTVSPVPKAFQPIRDAGAAGTHAGTGSTLMPDAGDGSLRFECLGPAGERLHEIRVYANAWNTIEDYTAFKTNGVASAVDPNRTGVAGVDCAAVNGSSCNSDWGFDDMIKDTTLGWGGNGDPTAWVFPYEDFIMPAPY